MWFIYSLTHYFLLSLVNYTDEHLSVNNKLPEKYNIHTKVGSVLIMSTLRCFVGAFILWLIIGDINFSSQNIILSFLASIAMTAMFASYFYVIQKYPAHQFVPLFQLTSIWLLLVDLMSGEHVTLRSLVGITMLIYGAYLLDAGTFKWKIPTKLLFIFIPITLMSATYLYIARFVSQTGNTNVFSFWQLIGIGVIGVVLFSFVKRYRDGFIYRIKNQGKLFLGLSAVNETLSETGYLFANLAVATAPVSAYFSSMSGLQSVFLLLLFFVFPHGHRSKIAKIQWIAVLLIMLGVFLIER